MNESNLNFEMIEPDEEGTRIKVVGVGGAGGNAINHMIASGVKGIEFICANTDAQAIENSRAEITISLGANGLGAGSKPEKGCAAALAAEAQIRDTLAGANLVFITAGMGGGTGTGAAPVIARIAKELGILTVGVVTMPFNFEGARRMRNAEGGLKELERNVDSLIVVLNDRLFDELGDDVTQHEAFAHANEVLRNAVGGIAEVIKVPGLVNVDFEDVQTVMGESGKAMMGTATSTGPDRARIAAEKAIACKLLDSDDLAGAKAVLVLISATRQSLKLAEIRSAMDAVREYTDKEPHLIFGTAWDESLGDNIRVTVIATGLSGKAAARRNPELTLVPHTGLNQHAVSALHAGPKQQPVAQTLAPSAGFNAAPTQLGQSGGGAQQPSSETLPLQRTGTDDPFPFSFPAMLAQTHAHATTGYSSALEASAMNPLAAGPSAGMGPAAGNAKPEVATSNVQQPSVFKNQRTMAAQKVEALSNGGMDDITIPAFLRKQAD